MTVQGGINGLGNIFSITPSGTLTDVYEFGSGTDGYFPEAGLLKASNGLFYGTTFQGGPDSAGTIFSFNISTETEKDLHNFGTGTDGWDPFCTLIQVNNGLLYGEAGSGGAFYDGVLFSYNISADSETVLYNFGTDPDGNSPVGALLQVGDTLLYGATADGGAFYGGTLFSYNIISGTETDLYDFGNGTDGNGPVGSLIQASNGLLYGMTDGGGVDSNGIIFTYNIATGKETDVHDFNNTNDGSLPEGGLFQASNGLLYGMTWMGGVYHAGIIFSYNITGDSETILYNLGDNYLYGIAPLGAFIEAKDSNLYGMTAAGGVDEDGTVISFNISTGTISLICSFEETDGNFPHDNLIEDDVTGIDRLSLDNNQLSIYPNPSSDFIYVSLTLPQTQSVQLSLYNMLGQEVWNTLTNPHTNSNLIATIPVTNLSNGVYVLKVNCGGVAQEKEVVVAR